MFPGGGQLTLILPFSADRVRTKQAGVKPDLKPVVASELRIAIEVLPTDFVVVEMCSRMLIKL